MTKDTALMEELESVRTQMQQESNARSQAQEAQAAEQPQQPDPERQDDVAPSRDEGGDRAAGTLEHGLACRGSPQASPSFRRAPAHNRHQGHRLGPDGVQGLWLRQPDAEEFEDPALDGGALREPLELASLRSRSRHSVADAREGSKVSEQRLEAVNGEPVLGALGRRLSSGGW